MDSDSCLGNERPHETLDSLHASGVKILQPHGSGLSKASVCFQEI